MRSLLPIAWAYEVMPDAQGRLGPHTTLVVRTTGDGYTVLGIFPGPELAERFWTSLTAAPHERLFDTPRTLGGAPADPAHHAEPPAPQPGPETVPGPEPVP
jgi:hypothetical protein